MIYYLEKELFKDGEESAIRTHIGETVLRLESIKRSMRKRILIYDRYHVPIGFIEKKVFKSGMHYAISYDDRVIATFSKKWSFFSKRFGIRTSGGIIFKIKGDIKNYKYKVIRGRSTVAKVYPSSESTTERFIVETHDREYKYVLLCVATIISIIN